MSVQAYEICCSSPRTPVLVTFCGCDKIPEKQLKGGKLCFGSWFQRFPSMMTWFCFFQACVWWGRTSWSEACGRAKWFTSWQREWAGKAGDNVHCLGNILPPVTYFFLLVPPLNSAIKFWIHQQTNPLVKLVPSQSSRLSKVHQWQTKPLTHEPLGTGRTTSGPFLDILVHLPPT
jgi:hypothetical protein